ncbi:HNH endonuclease [Microbispora sp. NBC_01389]|uniref:HNH endonuclease n=1 Tax=Microbispora sp. NBC_01389 TaxID=2903584 RepID=UPI00324767CF
MTATLTPAPRLGQAGGGHNRPTAERRRQIRRSLAKRDGARCFYCGTPFADVAEATLDHLIPQVQIPGWKLANLVLACYPCNRAKAAMLPQALLRPVGRFAPGLRPRPTLLGCLRTVLARVALPSRRVGGRRWLRAGVSA